MALAITLACLLVAVTFIFHYRVLLWLGKNTQKFNLQTQTQVLIIVIVLFITHIVEICIYAMVYNWSVSSLEIGEFKGAPVGSTMNYIYIIRVLSIQPWVWAISNLLGTFVLLPQWKHSMGFSNYMVCVIYISCNGTTMALDQ